MRLERHIRDVPSGYDKINFPLELIYESPHYPEYIESEGSVRLLNPHFHQLGRELTQNRKFEQHTKNPTPMPIDAQGRIFNGLELFLEFVKRSTYPYFYADEQLIEGNAQHLAELLDGAILVELCVGGGEKTARIVNMLARQGAKLKHLIINDIVPESSQHAKRTLHAGTNLRIKEDVSTVNGNIVGAKLWNTLNRHITEVKARKGNARVVVAELGATPNDFAAINQINILKGIGRVADDALLFVDHTRNARSLHRSYTGVGLADMLRGGVYHQIARGTYKNKQFHNKPADPGQTEVNLCIETEGSTSDLYIELWDHARKVLFRSTPIRKGAIELMEEQFRHCRMQVVGRHVVTPGMCNNPNVPVAARGAMSELDYGYWHIKPIKPLSASMMVIPESPKPK